MAPRTEEKNQKQCPSAKPSVKYKFDSFFTKNNIKKSSKNLLKNDVLSEFLSFRLYAQNLRQNWAKKS